ncbi:hypothetical protein VP01_14203g1, partial [Puccinia sorghi]
DLGKRTRTSKEQEEQQGMKRKKRQPYSVMDVDEEIFKIANTPLSTLDPSSQSFQPANKVRFQIEKRMKKVQELTYEKGVYKLKDETEAEERVKAQEER